LAHEFAFKGFYFEETPHSVGNFNLISLKLMFFELLSSVNCAGLSIVGFERIANSWTVTPVPSYNDRNISGTTQVVKLPETRTTHLRFQILPICFCVEERKVKIHLRERVSENLKWMDLAQDRVQWRCGTCGFCYQRVS
jgi:hypothetical protein